MQATADFDACLTFFWLPQNDGRARDGAQGEHFDTSFGITAMTWDHAMAQGIVSGSLDDSTQAQRRAVIRCLFWNALHCSSLAAGVDLMMFNDGVLCGTGHAARLLQRIVGATEDGVIGPVTLGLAERVGTQPLIDAVAAGDDHFFAALRTAPLFLRGWTRREHDAQQLAYRMAGITAAT